ncbi:MAG: amino-acid N-acetyltransferase [Pseudomonadales bacterium]|nr:amino-acid N-acetyltransferase [Pseudomonadales bacterium]
MADKHIEISSTQYARWFRDSTPYISAYRDKTFVVMLGGDALAHTNYINILHDLALLTVLGVRLIVVHGARPQIEEALKQNGLPSTYHNHLRITDAATLNLINSVYADIRNQIEACFSMGLPTTPLHNTEICVYGGNFVNAQPIGVVDGIDHQFTGQVRNFRLNAIEQALGVNSLVLVSPLGYSPAGETYNLSAEHLASELAITLNAEKLIFFSDRIFSQNESRKNQSVFTPKEARLLLGSTGSETDGVSTINYRLDNLIHACSSGVPSAQLVSFQEDGAILQELFTAAGHGTQIRKRILDEVRVATHDDIAGIIELIQPLEDAGVLVKRSRDKLEQEIEHFLVAEIDGVLAGCCALYPMQDEKSAELACLVAHPAYRHTQLGKGLGTELLKAACKKSKSLGISQLYALTTRTRDWFLENEFKEVGVKDLPASKQAMYNFQRNSKVLLLTIESEV